jgi:hypothetical protein
MARDYTDYLTKQLALLLYCCDLPQARWQEMFAKAVQIAEAWEQEDQALLEDCISD